MKSLLGKVSLLGTAAMLLTACATTSLKDSWRNQNLEPRRYEKVLVVSISKSEANRRVMEDVLVSDLKQRGVQAQPGTAWLPIVTTADRQRLEQAVRKSGAEAVLTVQTLRVDRQTAYTPGYATTYPTNWNMGPYSNWDFYGLYGTTTYYEPPTAYIYEVATIQVNLFDAQSGMLVWAASIESSDPGNLLTLSKDITDIIGAALVREGLI